MTIDDKIAIDKSREYQVVKSNDLVLKTRYDFTLNEQKTLAYICSLIKPISQLEQIKTNDGIFVLEYEFEILDYIRILGLEDNGKLYNDIKSILKGLRDKSIWLTLDDGTETTVGWLDKVWTNKRSGKVKIRLDEDLVPYLFDLRERYLSYGLYNILSMKSQYSIRVYEMLKAYYNLKVGQIDRRSKLEKIKNPKTIIWQISLDDLKRQLMVDGIKSYKNFNLFKTKVLEIAQREINELTDLQITWEPERKGRKVIAITFYINAKNGWDSLKARAKTQAKIDKIEV